MNSPDKCEKLMADATAKYGGVPRIDYFQGDFKYGPSWRVWWRTYHVHDKDYPKVSSGDLSCQGHTLAEALEKALNIEEEKLLFKGSCQYGCPGYSDGY